MYIHGYGGKTKKVPNFQLIKKFLGYKLGANISKTVNYNFVKFEIANILREINLKATN